MIANLVAIYEENKSIQDDEGIFEWYTEQIPAFLVGQTLWLEIAVYPTWTRVYKPETMKRTKYKIINIEHSVLRSYENDSFVFYKVEVTVRKVGDE
jgi:hypothetical protein